ncbi:unnamed protein product, partial [Ectocarpus fasciculatus]
SPSSTSSRWETDERNPQGWDDDGELTSEGVWHTARANCTHWYRRNRQTRWSQRKEFISKRRVYVGFVLGRTRIYAYHKQEHEACVKKVVSDVEPPQGVKIS